MVLKILRKNTKIVIWSVVLVFILWGGFSVGVQFQKKGRFAGEVFGKHVTFQEFNRYYRMAQLFSPKSEEESTSRTDEMIRRNAWENIMLSREARTKKVAVTDDEVKKEILEILKAQGIGELSQEYYQRWINTVIRMTPNEFENQVRELIRVQKFVRSIYNAPVDPPTQEEKRQLFLEKTKKISGEKLTFKSSEEGADLIKQIQEGKDAKTVLADLSKSNRPSFNQLNREAFGKMFSLEDKDVDQVFAVGQNQISNLIQSKDQFFAFYVTSAEYDSAATPDEESEKEIAEKITAQKRNLALLKWNIELFNRADFKDYQKTE